MAVAIFALLLPPKLTAVQAYQRMTDSLRDVRSAHSVVWNVLPDGNRVKRSEIWYQAGNWRVEDQYSQHGQVQVCRNGTRWAYNTEADIVTQDNAAFPEGYDGISGFSLAAMLHDSTAHGNRNRVTLLGSTTVAGRPAHVLLLYSQWVQDRREPTRRARIIMDDATCLPIRSEEQYRKPAGDQWTTDGIWEEQYNQQLSAGIFTPNFPETARLMDAAGREQWRKQLDEGIAAQKVAPTAGSHRHPATVVIRDFQVNAKGDVFLLFTANTEVGRDIPFGSAELTDESGTKYLGPSSQNGGVGVSDFIPNCVDTINSIPKLNGYSFGNKQLEGKRWVPLHKQVPWKPRRFRLTLHLAINTAEGEAGTAVFSLPVQRAEAEIVPGYMPYMARPLPSDPGVQGEE